MLDFKTSLLLFLDLVAGSANKQKHRTVKQPAPGCTTYSHDTQRSISPFKPQNPNSTTGFTLPCQHASFLLTSMQPLLHKKHSPTGFTCCSIKGLCSLSKFSIFKNKPNKQLQKLFQLDCHPNYWPPQFFLNLLLKTYLLFSIFVSPVFFSLLTVRSSIVLYNKYSAN